MYAARRWSVQHARTLQRIYDACARLAPLFAPALRLIGARRAERWLVPLEHAAKKFLFDCKMCGQCALSHTGMACPTNCKKQMRNGPCGGVRPDGGCEVDPAMRCVWIEALAGARLTGAPSLPALLPVDHRRQNRSSWIPVIEARQPELLVRRERTSSVERPPDERPVSGSFEQACRSGRFVVTAEVAPPDSADPAALIGRARAFDGLVDALNITDGAGGNCHMSSVAASAILVEHGFTPVYQVACRDRNRIAIQGDILGAAALGVRNVLCLTGDDVSQGDQPQAKPVFDLDAVSLLGIARAMRDDGVFASGRKLETPPRLFLGATANPFVPPHLDRIANLERKIAAGAQFIQTQFCFDVALLESFMREVRARGLHRHCKFIIGVGALRSARALRRMASMVPGVHIPEQVIARVDRADDQKLEGQRVCIETMLAVAQIEGVGGVHLMGHRNEDVLAQIIVESGLRRAV
ncbi:MAG: methylenetetrahydrofolate reductase C-terminal domain-containing protein [Betaproteobacteria bacterium]|nr:methylenetetrahydrofolate reductase C-terminal domain-containing protein [Betaproteobacteria bacterium]